MIKKIAKTVAAAMIAAAMLAGCASAPASVSSSQSSATVTPGASVSQSSADSQASTEKQNIVFWHSMGGTGGEAIDKMVADFNASQDMIEVTAQFQGNYDEAITKFQTVIGTEDAPDIMQLYEIGTRWMADSGHAVPVQELIDRDGWDASQLEPNIAGYYTINDMLYSMPFNSSTPLLYYNKDAFAAAGLDPEHAPANWDELEEYSRALTHKEGDETIYGVSLMIHGHLFEQYMSKQSLNYVNNGNGRDGTATAIEFDVNGGALNYLKKWDALNKNGLTGNIGRDSDAHVNALAAGQTYMIIQSTAGLNKILQTIDGKFELGTGFVPDLEPGQNGGVTIGGGCLWLMNKGTQESRDAAWECMKYLVEPEQQVYWHQQTGYFPVSVKAYDLQSMKDHLAAKPQWQTAIDQLHQSPVSARGALLGIFTESRQIVEKNEELMLAQELTPEQAVEEMSKAINASIEKYNIANS